MKKFIALTVAGVLLSGAAAAGPAHKHGHKHGYGHHHHNRVHVNGDFAKTLAAFALIAGTAIAIDAALDDYDDYDKPREPNGRPHRPHANAHDAKPRPKPFAGKANINQRQDRQAWRIREGVRSGELVRKEAKQLRKQQRRIAYLEADFRADGKFTKKERSIIQARLDNASKAIYRLKHNQRTRY